eukprot:CAMPEP_0117698936 /NCGR_PEP_ID=MMETSP0804-20121206/30013_1 /TAXON_ID=1074897 /ORGANISM="Tetraselmis astigmatica, Strain CCMP880" /LENGTH=47 /DNA_ID= /DNA_START= /DNA_END= /DNA_ORIENTATION=
MRVKVPDRIALAQALPSNPEAAGLISRTVIVPPGRKKGSISGGAGVM